MPVIASSAVRLHPPALLALAGGGPLAATPALWAWCGTAGFFEMPHTGWVACF